MPVRRTSEPTEEPVTVAEARFHVRSDLTGDSATDAAEDAWIARCISAAREACEARTGRTVMLCEWTLTLDGFPSDIVLPNPHVVAVDEVQFRDESGAMLTLAPSDYVLDNASDIRNFIVPAEDTDWPATSPDTINNVVVRYRAGWTNAAAVPKALKHWILMTAATYYKHREAVVTGNLAELPRSFIDGLLDPYMVYGV